MERTSDERPQAFTGFAYASEGELAAAMVPGHPNENAAWGEFQRRYGDRLMRFIISMMGDDNLDACKDVYSITLVERMLPAVERFRPKAGKASLLSWACHIARNVFLDQQKARKAGRIARFISLDEAAHELGIERPDAGPSDPMVTVAEEALERALESLTPRDQAILGLGHAGLSDREIAERLGITARLVSQARYKALERLRRRLERVRSATLNDDAPAARASEKLKYDRR